MTLPVFAQRNRIAFRMRRFVSYRGFLVLFFILLLARAGELRAQLYALSNQGTFDDPDRNLIIIDPATGAGTIVATVSNRGLFTGLAFDGTQFYTVDAEFGALYSINLRGSLSLIGSTGVDKIEGYLAYDRTSGILYGGWRNLYRLDTSNGTATLIGATGLDDPSGMDFDSEGNAFVLDMSINSDGIPRLYSLNISDGSTTLIGKWFATFPEAGGPLGGLAFINDQLYGIANGSGFIDQFYSIDRTTGVATHVGSINLRNFGSLTYVPESSPVLLRITKSDGQVILSWPANFNDYVPESTSTIDGLFEALNDAPVQEGDDLLLPLESTESQQIFRLRKQ